MLFANLASRKDSIRNMEERFIYDRLDRLTGIVEGNDTTGIFVYDNYGRMTSKYIHGAMLFDNTTYGADGRPHALEQTRRVLTAQKQLKNGTIKNVWPDDLPGYIRKDARIINPDAMDFNAQWIEFVKEKNAYIYDIGTPNENPVSSPFYNMEQARTMDYLNLIKVKGIDGKIIWYRNGN